MRHRLSVVVVTTREKSSHYMWSLSMSSLVPLLQTSLVLLLVILELLCYFGCRMKISCCCSKLVFHFQTSWRYLMWNSYKTWISGTSLAVLAYETGLHNTLSRHWLCSFTQHAACKLIQTCHATSFLLVDAKAKYFPWRASLSFKPVYLPAHTLSILTSEEW